MDKKYNTFHIRAAKFKFRMLPKAFMDLKFQLTQCIKKLYWAMDH